MRLKVWSHIRENAKEKGIFIDFVSGYSDHCHCLVSLGVDQAIQKTIQMIKGESAYWINKGGLLSEVSGVSLESIPKFEWQKEYFAVSVSESVVDRVRSYIKNQEEHHARKSYQEECDEIIEKYGFEKQRD